MNRKGLSRVANAVAHMVARLSGAESVYDTAKDVKDVAGALAGRGDKPSVGQPRLIVDAVERGLAETFKKEFRGIADNDLEAASLAVTDLLARQEVSSLIIRAAVDSAKLEEHLLDSGGAVARKNLGTESSQAAFNMLLRRSCQYIAEIGLSDKGFSAAALRALLQDQARLTEITSRILEAVSGEHRISAASNDYYRYTARYLGRLVEQLDFVDLPGVDLERHRQRYSLTAAYVPISLHGDVVGGSAELSTMEALLAMPELSLIIGDPGAGKSTLVKWATIQLAQDALSKLETTERTRIPILIKLRSIRNLPSLDDLGAPLTEGLAVDKPAGWSRELVESGNAVLLFDGLDEVPDDRREAVARWIGAIFLEHRERGLRVLVTSRGPAVREKRFVPRLAGQVVVEPMRQNHIERFVYYWHNAVLPNQNQGASQSAADQLLARLDQSPELFRVVANPLLCAVVCALYHARSQTLPSERTELYKALLDMLLGRRDEERSIGKGFLTRTEAERIVGHIAAAYQEREVSEADRGAVLSFIQEVLRGFASHNRRVRDLRPGLVLDYLVGRTGVLRELPSDDIDFWHRSFQEYLAAHYFVLTGRDRDIAARAEHPLWREVVIWSCAFLPRERASAVISRLQAQNTSTQPKTQAQLLSLIMACAHYTLELTEEVQNAVESIAQRMIPPLSVSQRENVVLWGESAVPFLEEYLQETAGDEEQRAALGAIIAIGGEAANSALAATSEAFKAKWAWEIGQGWRLHGSRDYASRVLASVPVCEPQARIVIDSARQLRSIDFVSDAYQVFVELLGGGQDADKYSGASDHRIRQAFLKGFTWADVLGFLERYPNVEEIVLTGFREASPVPSGGRQAYDRTFPAVRRLMIDGGRFPYYNPFRSRAAPPVAIDLDLLSVFPCLADLEVRGHMEAHGCKAFADNPELREVLMDEDVDVSDVSWGGSVRSLSVLDWPHATLEPLAAMPDLAELAVWSATGLITLEGLSSLASIEAVEVAFCDRLLDVSAALDSATLQTLTIVDCDDISDLPLGEEYAEFAITEDDVLGQTSYTLLPAVVPERWENPANAPSGALGAYEWDVWERMAFEERVDDSGDWISADPVSQTAKNMSEDGLVIYESTDEWLEAQRIMDAAD